MCSMHAVKITSIVHKKFIINFFKITSEMIIESGLEVTRKNYARVKFVRKSGVRTF